MNNIKNNIRDLIAVNLNESLEKILSIVSFHLDTQHAVVSQAQYDSVIMLKGQYLTAIQEYNQGIISRTERELVVQRTRSALLDIVNKMHESIFYLPKEIETKLENNELKKDVLTEKVDSVILQSNYDYDVFFSFSSKNIAEAKNIASKLRGYGLRVFFADESLKNRAGETYTDIINKALEDSTHFIWLCTKESSKSEWVKIEYNTFFNQIHIPNRNTRRFFILKGKGFDISLVPLIYRNQEFADAPEKIILNLPIGNRITNQKQKTIPNTIDDSSQGNDNKNSTIEGSFYSRKNLFIWFSGMFLLLALFWGIFILINKSSNNTKDTIQIPKDTTIQNTYVPNTKSILNDTPNVVASAIKQLENKTQQFDYPVVTVDGGEAVIGQDDPDIGCKTCSKDECKHIIKIEAFKIGKYEVTHKQWKQIMESSPMESKFKDLPDNPVESVSYEEIQKFLKLLRIKTGKTYRLPKEAEWEYAARGGKNSKKYDNIYAGSNELMNVGWFYGNSNKQTHKVGSLQPNDLGLYDMSGNVREWCEDLYATYSCDPVYRGDKDICVRGGSYELLAHFSRVSKRASRHKKNGFSDIGFRLVLVE